jgi:hypothetical protein
VEFSSTIRPSQTPDTLYPSVATLRGPTEPTSSSLTQQPSPLPHPNPSSNLDDSVVTKILQQHRIVTVTDSTGGITVQTSSAALNAPSTSRPSTTMVVSIVLGSLMLLIIMGAAVALLRRRKRGLQWKKATGLEEKSSEVREDHTPGSPWAPTFSSDSPSPRSSPSTLMTPIPWPLYREKGLAALNTDLTLEAHQLEGAPPPAYRPHSGSVSGSRW